MKRHLFPAVLVLTATATATAALAQTTPGDQFMQRWDLDGNGAATLEELREMRGNVFMAFDADQNDILDAEEYVYFDEARANDVANYEAEQRDQMQAVADGMSLTASDTNGDGVVGREEFLAGTEGWFADLDTNGDDVVTLDDFAM
ncbi:EF-hand domain-containing protein [Roseovarius sp. SYSU LYC5161]|uniref:EF-hand domain-containing protein n=1 Tax=Roseovarius halophilus (ex Wu et al. 2025) TaxID=3376060 RepID=UPI00399A63F5